MCDVTCKSLLKFVQIPYMKHVFEKLNLRSSRAAGLRLNPEATAPSTSRCPILVHDGDSTEAHHSLSLQPRQNPRTSLLQHRLNDALLPSPRRPNLNDF